MKDSSRNANGRFVRGNPGGPGRPPRRVEDDFLRGLADMLTPDQWTAVCRRAIDDAINGDAKAREWLSGYVLPKPGDGALKRMSDEEARQDRIERGVPRLADFLGDDLL